MEKLKNYLFYNARTGEFHWLHKRGKRKAGSVAGSLDSEGYVRICFEGKYYKAHRLAWFFTYGSVPKQLDHINRNKADNRVENLRPCNDQQNQANSGPMPSNTSGYRGIYYEPERAKWVARARITTPDGKRVRKHLGRFDTAEEAAKAYDKFRGTRYGEFALKNF